MGHTKQKSTQGTSAISVKLRCVDNTVSGGDFCNVYRAVEFQI